MLKMIHPESPFEPRYNTDSYDLDVSDLPGPARLTGPEHLLLKAILLRALADLYPHFESGSETRAKRRDIRQAARIWFLSSDQRPGSFLFICDHLHLDAEYIRQKLHLYNHRRARYARVNSNF